MDVVAFPRGSLILESQLTIMKLLRVAVEGILEGSNPEVSSTKWTALIDTNFRGATGQASVTNPSLHPYSTLTDFLRLPKLLIARPKIIYDFFKPIPRNWSYIVEELDNLKDQSLRTGGNIKLREPLPEE
ncbi:hypothetical protein NHQ30_004244 [Ciborinia camelliae]|nr:hypothetical protein NHQ30_004244 [Ciborinia camelliae]